MKPGFLGSIMGGACSKRVQAVTGAGGDALQDGFGGSPTAPQHRTLPGGAQQSQRPWTSSAGSAERVGFLPTDSAPGRAGCYAGEETPDFTGTCSQEDRFRVTVRVLIVCMMLPRRLAVLLPRVTALAGYTGKKSSPIMYPGYCDTLTAGALSPPAASRRDSVRCPRGLPSAFVPSLLHSAFGI